MKVKGENNNKLILKIKIKTEIKIKSKKHCLVPFDWDDMKILDVERNYSRRLISEMINIKCQNKSINLQTDTESLSRAYASIFKWD